LNRSLYVRAAAIYLPLVAAAFAGLLRPRRSRQLAACLLSLFWTLCTLLLLQRLNQLTGWWTFSPGGLLFRGMPLELYFGWAMLWGLVPQLAFPKGSLAWVSALMIAFDLVAMPLCKPVLYLGNHWIAGEGFAVLLVLLPALLLARWTLDDTHLELRAALQIVLSGMLFLFLVPELVFAVRAGDGWLPLLHSPSWQRQLGLQLLLLLALPGVSAVAEFSQRGHGTPLPYDPPKHLVTSGIYRYCANPMQLSCGMVMLLWAAMLHNVWLLLAACMSILYSAGIAEWDEGRDLAERFKTNWQHYRDAVPSWRVRWRPYHSGAPARLYIARTCGPCSELRLWMEGRHPIGLDLIDAETLPAGSIQRLRYDPANGSAPVEGIRALGRALEHLHLGWAFCGAALRLPLVWQSVQLLMDASGLGPRILGDMA
jgi:protein-S-isoprenylcysteine O-methyltransferase Ste14